LKGKVNIEPRLNTLRCPAELNWVNREGAKGVFFVGFVVILEEGFRIRTHQALTGGNSE